MGVPTFLLFYVYLCRDEQRSPDNIIMFSKQKRTENPSYFLFIIIIVVIIVRLAVRIRKTALQCCAEFSLYNLYALEIA